MRPKSTWSITANGRCRREVRPQKGCVSRFDLTSKTRHPHCPHVLVKAPDDRSSATGGAARMRLSGDDYFCVIAVKKHVRIPASRSAVALAKKSKPRSLRTRTLGSLRNVG
ncbi:hypothetical protein BDV10DRAFT_157270 [Aspergillus recurvatus]